MHVCAEYGNTKLFEYFKKEYDAELNVTNKLRETPFTTAAREGRLLIIKLHFEKYHLRFDPDARTVDEWSAFSYACINGFLNTIEYLASKKVNIHTSDRNKRTALHWAVRFDNAKVTELLLNLNMNHQAHDIEGKTP